MDSLGQGGHSHDLHPGRSSGPGRRHHGPAEAQAHGLSQAPRQLRHLTDLAAEADLAAHHEIRRQRPAAHGRGQRQPEGEIGGRLGHPHPTRDRGVHVSSGERQPHALLEDGELQRHAPAVQALRRSPGHRQLGRGHQRLELDEQRTLALHGRKHHTAWDSRLSISEQQLAGIGDAGQARLRHLEQSKLSRGTEAVLGGPQQPEGVVTLPLERQHGVDDMLEDARSGQGALLGHVAHEQGGHGRRLGHLQQL